MINDYDPIADLYDIYVPATYDIPFFLNETGKTTGEVLELMSGTGRVSLPLLQAGVRLTCVDLSAELNAICEQKIQQAGLQAMVYQMDVCTLDLPQKFAMVIIPFHSFAHIVSPDNQRKALQRIRQHLLPGGTFICTLGNPAVRKQAVDGQMRLFRKYPLENESGALLLWIAEKFDPADGQVVNALQFFEEYDDRGVLKAKRLLELHFRLTTREAFESMARAAGFEIQALYGDYEYSEFNPDSSPFMIWVLKSAG